MKFDLVRNVLIREKYQPEYHWGNLGDSCAETCRAWILGNRRGTPGQFVFGNGFVRHPLLKNVPGWDQKDFTNDQLLPLMMVMISEPPMEYTYHDGFKIKGTKKILSIGSWALIHGHYRILNFANVVQGWLFNLSWRFADGGKIERSHGKVQDWLNYICVFVFLRSLGKKATLNQPVERCIAAVRKYYLEGDDWEPNSQWIVDAYETALS